MAFKFEQLRVWQVALAFGEKINVIADDFPRKELFNLSNQIRRAADSIGLDIAEGSTGQSNAEQKRFLIFANRSTLEVVACVTKAKLRAYVDEKNISGSLYRSRNIGKNDPGFYSKTELTIVSRLSSKKLK